MSTLRTFIAVEAAPPVRKRIVSLIHALRAADAEVKWVDDEILHWTLKFLGEVDEREVTDVCRAVTAAVDQCAPFDLSVRGVGAFPNLERPRTIWLGSDDGVEQMVALAEVIEHALKPMGFKREPRPFHPHLTIGRVRGPNRMRELSALLRGNAAFDAGTSRVSEVVVFSSDLQPAGPRYTALARGKMMR